MKKNLLVLILHSSFLILHSYAQPPASCTASIGSPANGAAHYISISWASVPSATSYDLEYSTDGNNWNNLYSGNSTSYNHNTGATGNLPFYYRVRAIVGGNPSSFTNATQYPVYSACDEPALPQVSTAGPYSLSLVIVDGNPVYTTYSIYCTTASQYVQANGTLGGAEVFQTASTWGNLIINGLNEATEYCFYLKARNMDGDVRMASGATIMAVETFTTSANFSTQSGSGPTNMFWSPSSCTTGGLTYSATGGCSGGYVGKTGSFNNFFGCFLRTPQQNCTGNATVILNFDISNSYFPSHVNDKARFYMWVDGAYKRASSVKIAGVEVGVIDVNGIWLKFDEARTCVNVDVTFDLTASTNLFNILFYIEPNCGYNNSNVFSVKLDNISLRQGSADVACATTEACVASGISSEPPQTVSVCEGGSVSFGITTYGNTPVYQWEYSDDGGTSWNMITNDATYSGATTATLTINNAMQSMDGYKYHCLSFFACSGTATSNAATLIVNTVPSAPLEVGGPTELCDGEEGIFSFGAVTGATGYTWSLPAAWQGSSTTTSIIATAIANSGNVSVTADNACGSSAPATLYVTVYDLPSVAFDPSENSFCINDSPFPFDGTTPTGGLFSGNGVVAGNFNPAVAGIGQHQICYTYTDFNGCSASSCEIFTVDLCTGIDELQTGFEVFPNPFTNEVNIKFSDTHTNGALILCDITGKIISEKFIEKKGNNFQFIFSDVSRGFYFMKFVETTGKTSVVRLIKE